MTATANITAADVGTIVDGVPIGSAPDVGCYGCQGTGRLRWGGIPPSPCICVQHAPDCEPDCCDPACPTRDDDDEGAS